MGRLWVSFLPKAVGHLVRGSLFLIFGWVDVGRGSLGSWVTWVLGNFRGPLPSLVGRTKDGL